MIFLVSTGLIFFCEKWTPKLFWVINEPGGGGIPQLKRPYSAADNSVNKNQCDRDNGLSVGALLRFAVIVQSMLVYHFRQELGSLSDRGL